MIDTTSSQVYKKGACKLYLLKSTKRTFHDLIDRHLPKCTPKKKKRRKQEEANP